MKAEDRLKSLRAGKKPVVVHFTTEQHTEIKGIASENNRSFAGQVRQWCNEGIVREDPAYRAYVKR